MRGAATHRALGRLDQDVKLRAGRRPSGRVTEQTVLSADDKRADGTVGCVVVDRQITVLDVAFQPAPVAGQIADGITQRILDRDLWLRFLYPVFQLGLPLRDERSCPCRTRAR